MNFSEFKELLGSDPYSQDPEFLRLKNQPGEFADAARHADAFERQLQYALAVKPSAEFLESLSALAEAPVRRRNPMVFAMAASLFVAAGAFALFAWNAQRYATLEEFVLSHYSHDGHRVEQSATEQAASLSQINQIMANVDSRSADALASKIHYIKNCPTKDGKGVHMVVMTDSGPVTVIYMPNSDVESSKPMDMGEKQGLLVSLDRGSAALIGDSMDQLKQLEPDVRRGILLEQSQTL